MFTRTILLPFLVVLLVALSAFAIFENQPEQISLVPAEEIPPEQSYYAVFYFVCGKFQVVLVTTEPPVMGFAGKPDPSELPDLLKATPVERIIELRYVGPECYYSTPQQTPVEPIL